MQTGPRGEARLTLRAKRLEASFWARESLQLLLNFGPDERAHYIGVWSRRPSVTTIVCLRTAPSLVYL